ncbi:MAG: FAD-dependent oxidoreductase [Aigarchaeota archaeon]|nr:FAD-dependent oxidoreductase [Candidatus Pelearchaeum maunauluense]
MVEKFDVVVVGAGPAGSAAAITLAREGYDVLLLEKAKVPGHRNITGGVLFGRYLPGYGMIDLIPEFEEEAPLERRIVAHELYALQQPQREDNRLTYRLLKMDKRSIATRLGLTMLNVDTGHDYTVLRARFDKWMASKAVEAGAIMVTGKSVEHLLTRGNQVVGVVTDDNEEIMCNVVIDCGGVTSRLVEQAGLRGKLEPHQVYHGVKHVYKLEPTLIEERFSADGGFKAVYLLGDFMHSTVGGGFLYPNRDTVSVGIVAGMDSLIERLTSSPNDVGKPLDMVEEMESHPFVWQLIEGGSLVEYSAHNIPRGYKTILETPYTSGFLVAGDALGAFVKIGALIDGMRRAIASGIMAAETYIHAHGAGDFTYRTLAIYRKLLSPIYRDVAASKRNSALLERRFFYETMPRLMFSLGLAQKRNYTGEEKKRDLRDAIQRIQERTGLLDYEEDKEYSHIKVDTQKASQDRLKAWIPLCPVNCYTLITPKGVFASFKDLYEYNLAQLGGRAEEALRTTFKDVEEGAVRFDHVACVACGTCGVIGPPGVVDFGHERQGHGVQYKYG